VASASFEMKSFHLPFFVFTTTSCNIYYTTSLERIAKQQQHKQQSPLALVGSRFCNGLLNSIRFFQEAKMTPYFNLRLHWILVSAAKYFVRHILRSLLKIYSSRIKDSSSLCTSIEICTKIIQVKMANGLKANV
jgi:hypothetical protein